MLAVSREVRESRCRISIGFSVCDTHLPTDGGFVRVERRSVPVLERESAERFSLTGLSAEREALGWPVAEKFRGPEHCFPEPYQRPRSGHR